MMEKSRPRPPRALRATLPFVLAALYIPLIVMVLGSFLERSSDGDTALTLRWYAEIFSDPVLWEALSRSLLIAVFTATIATVLGTLGALAMDKWDFPGKRILRGLSTVSLMLPELVLALSLLSWFAVLHVELSLFTVVAAHVTLTLPFVTLVIASRLKALDPSYDDAARDLGAGEGAIFVRVTLPLLRPAMVTGFLLAFLLSFDDFLVTFYTNGAGTDTLPVKLYSMMKTGLSPKIQALSSVMLVGSVALITLLVVLQREKRPKRSKPGA